MNEIYKYIIICHSMPRTFVQAHCYIVRSLFVDRGVGVDRQVCVCVWRGGGLERNEMWEGKLSKLWRKKQNGCLASKFQNIPLYHFLLHIFSECFPQKLGCTLLLVPALILLQGMHIGLWKTLFGLVDAIIKPVFISLTNTKI